MESSRAAEILVQLGSVAFRADPPFQFTSGAVSPVYVDNRRLLSFVDARRELVAGLADTVAELAAGRPFNAVAGTATAGIPWAAWLADALDQPMLYARSQPKTWGHERSVEGVVTDGARVVLVEDLLYSGGSAIASVENLRAAGAVVDACVCIVTYDTPNSRRLEAGGVTVRALTTVDEALRTAESLGLLSAPERATVGTWLEGVRTKV
jgi:orotate phosphoribosyltransferase